MRSVSSVVSRLTLSCLKFYSYQTVGRISNSFGLTFADETKQVHPNAKYMANPGTLEGEKGSLE